MFASFGVAEAEMPEEVSGDSDHVPVHRTFGFLMVGAIGYYVIFYAYFIRMRNESYLIIPFAPCIPAANLTVPV